MTDRGTNRGVQLGADVVLFVDALESTAGGTANKHGWGIGTGIWAGR